MGVANTFFQSFTVVSETSLGTNEVPEDWKKSKNNPDNYHLEHLISPSIEITRQKKRKEIK